MATFTWTLQGDTNPTTIGDTDIIQFAGGTFDSPVTVSEYQDSTHVKSSGGADDSDGNDPLNSKFISNDGGTAGDGQGDWGDGTEDIDQITTAECPLKINFSHGSSVITTNGKLYAYNGSSTATGPTDVTFWAAEQGDANWTQAEGSGSAVSITDDTTATSHDYFFLISASPESVGLKSAFRVRIELTYS